MWVPTTCCADVFLESRLFFPGLLGNTEAAAHTCKPKQQKASKKQGELLLQQATGAQTHISTLIKGTAGSL